MFCGHKINITHFNMEIYFTTVLLFAVVLNVFLLCITLFILHSKNSKPGFVILTDSALQGGHAFLNVTVLAKSISPLFAPL